MRENTKEINRRNSIRGQKSKRIKSKNSNAYSNVQVILFSGKVMHLYYSRWSRLNAAKSDFNRLTRIAYYQLVFDMTGKISDDFSNICAHNRQNWRKRLEISISVFNNLIHQVYVMWRMALKCFVTFEIIFIYEKLISKRLIESILFCIINMLEQLFIGKF